MQHLGARFPGALPPSCLFPYLGGKRNRETQGDRSVRPGVLPVQPSLGRGHQATSRVGGTGVFRLRLGVRLLAGQTASAAHYGTAALHPVPRSIASPAATLAAEPCPPGAEPAPATHPRAQTHASPTNTRVHTHKHVRAHTHTHGYPSFGGNLCVYDQGTPD